MIFNRFHKFLVSTFLITGPAWSVGESSDYINWHGAPKAPEAWVETGKSVLGKKEKRNKLIRHQAETMALRVMEDRQGTALYERSKALLAFVRADADTAEMRRMLFDGYSVQGKPSFSEVTLQMSGAKKSLEAGVWVGLRRKVDPLRKELEEAKGQCEAWEYEQKQKNQEVAELTERRDQLIRAIEAVTSDVSTSPVESHTHTDEVDSDGAAPASAPESEKETDGSLSALQRDLEDVNSRLGEIEEFFSAGNESAVARQAHIESLQAQVKETQDQMDLWSFSKFLTYWNLLELIKSDAFVGDQGHEPHSIHRDVMIFIEQLKTDLNGLYGEVVEQQKKTAWQLIRRNHALQDNPGGFSLMPDPNALGNTVLRLIIPEEKHAQMSSELYTKWLATLDSQHIVVSFKERANKWMNRVSRDQYSLMHRLGLAGVFFNDDFSAELFKDVLSMERIRGLCGQATEAQDEALQEKGVWQRALTQAEARFCSVFQGDDEAAKSMLKPAMERLRWMAEEGFQRDFLQGENLKSLLADMVSFMSLSYVFSHDHKGQSVALPTVVPAGYEGLVKLPDSERVDILAARMALRIHERLQSEEAFLREHALKAHLIAPVDQVKDESDAGKQEAS